MSWKRLIALSSLLLALAVLGPSALAGQEPGTEPKPTGGEKPAEEAKPAAEAPKTSFWGDRFSLYIEANTGGASTARDIESSIESSTTSSSQNGLDLNSLDYGRLAVGWKLPAQRGHLLLVWTGHRETGYQFDATGNLAAARPRIGDTIDPAARPIPNPVVWWRVNLDDGQLSALQSVPILEEDGSITYEYDNPSLNTSLQGRSAANLGNSAQTVDALYQREFGGRTWSGRWSAGLRYFTYQGTVPVGAWLSSGAVAGVGYTDGLYIHLVSMRQDTSGLGPTGSLEAQYHLFRNRLVLYLQGRIAFVYQNLETDSGPIFTLVRNSTLDTMFPAPTRLNMSRSKTSWQVAVEAGLRVRILPGFEFEAGMTQSSYQDCVLLPTRLLMPTEYGEAMLGTSALYGTQDFLVNVWHAGFSYQF